MDNSIQVLNFLFELGAAERIKRTGPWVYGIKDPENIAEHCYRVAIVTFILASLEKKPQADVFRLTMYSLFHDVHEIRLLDRNGISQRYMATDNAVVDEIRDDQFMPLGKETYENFQRVIDLTEEEFLLVKDADFIEDGLRAKEHTENGFKGMEAWIDDISNIIQTKSAKRLWKDIRKVSYLDWTKTARQTLEEMKVDYLNKK